MWLNRWLSLSLLMNLTGMVAVFLGVTVLIGWYTSIYSFIQIRPGFAPMQYNTALEFLLSGLAFLSITKMPRVAVILGLIITLIAGITLLEYIFSINLGIDELFIKSYFTFKSTFPGRMAPNTTICFFIIGVILLIRHPHFLFSGKALLSFMLSLLIMTIGMVALFGYLANIPTVYGWGQWAQMAVHTAIGITIMSSVLSIFLWHEGRIVELHGNVVFPISTFIFGSLFFLLLWQALIQSEHQRMQKIAQQELTHFGRLLSIQLNDYFMALDRMLARLSQDNRNIVSSKQVEAAWRLDAKNYLRDFPNFVAIATIFSDQQWLEKQPNLSSEVNTSLLQCMRQSGSFNFFITKQNYLCKIDKTKQNILLYALIDISQLMSKFNKAEIEKNYGIELLSGKQILYESSANFNQSIVLKNLWSSNIRILLANDITFNLRLWPKETYVKQGLSLFPAISVLTGLIITLLLTVLIRVMQNMQITKNALMQEEKKTRLIFEKAREAYIAADADSRILDWNHQAEVTFGWTRQEVLGKTLLETIIPPQYREAHLRGMEHYLKSGEGPVLNKRIEFTALRKNGEEFPVELSITSVEFEGKPIFSAFAYDITERKQIEKMKNEFISVVSHELRTPLTSIHGSLSLLSSGKLGKFSFDVDELLAIAKNNSERLIRLINDILDIEKIESGSMQFHLENIELNSLVEEAIIVNQAYAKKFSVSMKLIEQLSHVYVNVDHDRLLQVLTNLLSNAVKFSPMNEEISISISMPMENKIRVSISDRGKGISEEFKPHAFKRFSQADTSSTRENIGTGLGLNISKAIIEKLNGSIGFVSKPDKGSTFYFDLPIVVQSSIKYKKEIYKKTPTILICDPNENNANLIMDLLKPYDFDVIIKTTAAEVKQVTKTRKIDALILSLILPDQDGISLLTELRKNSAFNHTPIIVTAIQDNQKQLEEISGGVLNIIDWIQNPPNVNQLVHAITKMKESIDAKMLHILYIEDDFDLAHIVASSLKQQGEIVNVGTLKEARDELQRQIYHVVILDLRLPDGSGIQLLPYLSQRHIPVVVFSAYELPQEYVKEVSSVFIKSKTSQDELVAAIQSVVRTNKIDKGQD